MPSIYALYLPVNITGAILVDLHLWMDKSRHHQHNTLL